MNVGSLAEFTSTVVYSSQGHIVVQVKKGPLFGTLEYPVSIKMFHPIDSMYAFFLKKVVVMTVDIKSGLRSKTNVLTYIFR